jgi:hypothetical protein
MEDETVESQDLQETTEDTTTSQTTVEGEEESAGANLEAENADLKTKNAQLFERLQKAKGLVKQPDGTWAKPAVTAPAPKPAETAPTGLTREEGILFSKGFDEAEVEHAQKVATLQGVKLTEAIKDPLFTTWKSNKDADVKKQQAQLGTSKGARTTVKKSLDTPGLSDEDHKELFKEMIG